MKVDMQVCPTCGNRKKRSIRQNSRYWLLIRMMATRGKDFSAEVWHTFFKREFLPMIDVQLPDWTTQLVETSTADLPMHPDPNEPDAPNWDTYTLQVEQWCAERGIYLPE